MLCCARLFAPILGLDAAYGRTGSAGRDITVACAFFPKVGLTVCNARLLGVDAALGPALGPRRPLAHIGRNRRRH